MSDWHDTSCSRPDVNTFDDGTPYCLSCGSMATEAKDVVSSTSDRQFIYPLIIPHSETRLIRLYPGSLAAPIKCDVVIGRLEDLPDYEAISYTWADESGDSTKCRVIYIESRPFLVTSNCEAALKRVRYSSSYRRIWIDAISINQDNNEEKSRQVQLMPEIYARALRVVVYIGEAEDDSDIVLDYLLNGYSSMLLRQKSGSNTFAALQGVLSRRYFSRVWILQEVALARQAVLVCGTTTVPWSCFTIDNLTARHMLDRSSSKLIASIPLPPVIHFDAPRYKDPDHLMSLLDLARPCEASDPRDKVFALIGLITGAHTEGLMADYALTVEQIYTSVAAYIARRVGCVAVISRVSLTSRFPGLPSWVPDWSSPGDFLPGVAIHKDPKPASVDKLQSVLTIYGIEIDKLSVLSNGEWSTAKGFDASLEGHAQPGDALYQICNTDKGDELYRQDPYWFTYPCYRGKIFNGPNTDLRYAFVLRRHSENHFKITGRCRLLRIHSGVIWEEWKKWREKQVGKLEQWKQEGREWKMWEEWEEWRREEQEWKWEEWEWKMWEEWEEWRREEQEWKKQEWEWKKQEWGWKEQERKWKKQEQAWKKQEWKKQERRKQEWKWKKQEWEQEWEWKKQEWEWKKQEWERKKQEWERKKQEWERKNQWWKKWDEEREWKKRKEREEWEREEQEGEEKDQEREWEKQECKWNEQLCKWKNQECEWEKQECEWKNQECERKNQEHEWDNQECNWEKQEQEWKTQERTMRDEEREWKKREVEWEWEKEGEWEKRLREWREKEREWEKRLNVWREMEGEQLGEWEKRLMEKEGEWEERLKEWREKEGEWKKHIKEWREMERERKKRLNEQWEKWGKQLKEGEREKRFKEWELGKWKQWGAWKEWEKRFKEWEWGTWKQWGMWKEWEKEWVVKKIEII